MHPLLSHRARTATSSAIRDLLKLAEQPGILSLAGGLPAAASFPTDLLRAEAVRVLDDQGPYGPQALQYGRTEGVTELRELLAKRCGSAMSSIVVTTGSQQALDLVSRCIIDPGDVVVVEAPTYVGALQAMRSYQPAFEPITGDRDGLDTDLLEQRLLAGLRPAACYVVSNFANPTGATMSPPRREHLLRLAQQYGFVILEDDPYGDLRFRGTAVPSIRSLPGGADHVVLLRTVSKTVAPGLRIGWAVLPDWLVSSVVVAKQGVDLHTATLSQYLALGMLADEAAHAERVRISAARYGLQAEALQTAVARHLGDILEVGAIDGGMFLWAKLFDESVDTTVALHRALQHGVAYVPGAAFYAVKPGDDTPVTHSRLRMSFASLAPDQFDEAARRMALALRS
jgi:2-aminoadipate transaminase